MMEKRADTRNSTKLKIGISPFTTNFDAIQEIGTLCNYSSNGIFIESERCYPEGSILIVQVLNIPQNASNTVGEEGLKSVCIAQVKWLKDKESTWFSRYKIGLRYLQ